MYIQSYTMKKKLVFEEKVNKLVLKFLKRCETDIQEMIPFNVSKSSSNWNGWPGLISMFDSQYLVKFILNFSSMQIVLKVSLVFVSC